MSAMDDGEELRVGQRVEMYDGRSGIISNMNDRIVWIVRDGERWEHPYGRDEARVWADV